MDAFKLLEQSLPLDIVQNLRNSYQEIVSNFVLKKWKASELDAGHFVETTRRIIELELTGAYTSFTSQLPNFNDDTLKKYESYKGDESLRILIPRILKSIYNLRNKRGVGHPGSISPNEMDATYILYSVKWVMAEIVRLKSNISIIETQAIIDNLVERQVEIIWKDEDFVKVLSPNIPAKEQVLILLYNLSPQTFNNLITSTEYKKQKDFRKILQTLHKKKLIHFGENNVCKISTLGIVEAEKIILSRKRRGS